MGSFARPKNGDPEAGKKPLPELRPGAVVASPPKWKGSPEKRARLEALRRKSLEPEKVAREIAAAQRAAAAKRVDVQKRADASTRDALETATKRIIAPVFREMDTDRSGQLSYDEFADAIAGRGIEAYFARHRIERLRAHPIEERRVVEARKARAAPVAVHAHIEVADTTLRAAVLRHDRQHLQKHMRS